MNRVLITIATICSIATAGSIFPTMATLVNEKGNEKSIDPTKFGYIGLAFQSSLQEEARMDLKEISTGNKIRISLNPELDNTISFSLGPIVIGEKKFSKDTISRLIIVQQLPPGNYATTYFYLSTKSSGISLKPDTLHVENGKILSLGNLKCEVELVPLIQTVKKFRTWTTSSMPDSMYTPFEKIGVPSKGVVHETIDLQEK